MYSDQPVMPSSVVIFRKELTRQPASQCKSSILVIFTGRSRSAGGRHAPPGPAGSTPRVEAMATCDALRGVFHHRDTEGTEKSLSLRGAQRRSNPHPISQSGARLLRFARNDSLFLSSVPSVSLW